MPPLHSWQQLVAHYFFSAPYSSPGNHSTPAEWPRPRVAAEHVYFFPAFVEPVLRLGTWRGESVAVLPCPNGGALRMVDLWVVDPPGPPPGQSSLARFREVLSRAVGLLDAATCGASGSMGPPQVVVVWIRCPQKRRFPPVRGQRLGVENVNGGVTTYSNNPEERTVVFVTREEEAQRVLLHELLHLYGVDRAISTSTRMRVFEETLALRCGIKSEGTRLGTGEAVVDALACWLHACWHASRASRGEGTDTAKAAAHLAMTLTQDHIQQTATRVLRHYGRASAFADREGGATIDEGTHVFSYYIIKAALWGAAGGLPRLLEHFPPARAFPVCADTFMQTVSTALRGWSPVPFTKLSGGDRVVTLRMSPDLSRLSHTPTPEREQRRQRRRQP